MSGDQQSTRAALRQRWLIIAALSVLLCYNAPLITLRSITLRHDGVLQYYPAEHALAEALRSGTLPFWTPHLQAGFPLLAQGQPGPLYPINVLAFGLLPTPLAHTATLMFHQLLAFAFTIWWGRMLGIGSVGAVGMGLLFSLAPPLNGGDVLLIDTVTWIPLLLGLAERCVRRATPRAAVAMIPVAAIQWLAGFPQIALYTALTTHIYLGVRVCGEDWTWVKRGSLLAAWSCATVLGVLLAAPQLLPTYELSHYSIRAGGIPEGLAGEKSLFPATILTFVLPSLRRLFQRAGLGMGVYLGILPGALAVATMCVRPRRPWFYALLAVTATTLLLALGQYSPLFFILRRVPGFAFFRIPSRYLYITQLGLITFAGLGWDVFVAGASSAPGRALRRCLQGALAILVAVVLGRPLLVWARPNLLSLAERYTVGYVMANPFHSQSLSYFQAKIAALYSGFVAAVSLRHPKVLLPLVVAVGGTVSWSWWGSSDRRRRRWLAAFWACLAVLDVVAAADWCRDVTLVSVVSEDPPVVRRLKSEIGGSLCRFYSFTDDGLINFGPWSLTVLQANYNLAFDLSSAGIYAPLAFDSYNQLMDRLGTVDLGIGFHPVGVDDLEHDRGLLDLLNVCYVLSRQPLTGFTPVAQVEQVWVYRNEQAFPRAFTVGRTEVASASVAWVKLHRDRLRDTAVVEEPLRVELSADAAARALISVTDYRHTAVAIDVTTADAVLLVLTDTDYPGWHAFVDGKPTRLYRTDALFRGVVVPRGTHRVEFRYQALVFWRGLSIAAAALAALGWAYATRTQRPRHNASDGSTGE